jgi:hypothetical protein
MAYLPIQTAPDTPPVVHGLVRGAIEPFLSDVHAMLRLPTDDSLPGAGCNLSIAQVLLASISGLSAVLYSTTLGTGAAFRGLLTEFYPWASEPMQANVVVGEEAARILYDEYRNPLAHASGTAVFSPGPGKPREYRPSQRRLQINRINIAADANPDRGLLEHRINELESSTARPWWLAPTLKTDEDKIVLCAESLYWGFRIAVQSICADQKRAQAAVVFFRARPRLGCLRRTGWLDLGLRKEFQESPELDVLDLAQTSDFSGRQHFASRHKALSRMHSWIGSRVPS